MKKLVFCLFALTVVISLSAQVAVSPILGVSINNVKHTFPENFNTKSVLRHFMGVQGSFGFSEKFSVGLGLQYATKGYESNTNSIWRTEALFKYLEFMPYTEYKPIRFVGIMAGAGVGLLLDEKYRASNGPWNSSGFNLLKPVDISGTVGLRFYLSKLFLGLMFNRSVASSSDINYTDENGNPIGNAKEYHQSLSLGVGYNFHLKKK